MINILVADDEKEIIKLIRLYLEKEDINIYEAYDGAMAYFILQNYEIDLAIIDIMMPKLNGFELITKVRKTMELPIIVLSAKVDLSDRILGLDLGADDYVTKPFEPLTKTEFLVLKLFMENPGRVFTKENIYESGWGEEYIVDDNTIRVIISRIRDKLGEGYITTIRGLGYRWEKE